MLPLGTRARRRHAAGPGRVARPSATDAVVGSEPGKILHEVRIETLPLGAGRRSPTMYYGTIDATPLWISLLHDAWCWGLPSTRSPPLLDPLERAVAWVARRAATARLPVVPRRVTGRAWPTRAGRTPATRSSDSTGGLARAADHPVRGAGLRLPGAARRRSAARRVRASGRDPLGAAGGRTRRHGSVGASGWATVRTGSRPSPSTDDGRRSTRSRRTSATSSAPACSTAPRRPSWRPRSRRRAPGRRVRAAHADRRPPPVQPARLPLRLGLAARHGDRRHGPGRRRPSRAGGPARSRC